MSMKKEQIERAEFQREEVGEAAELTEKKQHTGREDPETTVGCFINEKGAG